MFIKAMSAQPPTSIFPVTFTAPFSIFWGRAKRHCAQDDSGPGFEHVRDRMAPPGDGAPRSPEMTFLGFCRKWFEKRGRP
ncbi:hypothetical protein [Roseivivax sediminis]|nr:hypothetical protein [Roseivivax sediminis]